MLFLGFVDGGRGGDGSGNQEANSGMPVFWGGEILRFNVSYLWPLLPRNRY